MTYSDTYVGKLVLTLRAAEDERDAALARCERLQEALRKIEAYSRYRSIDVSAPDDEFAEMCLSAATRCWDCAREALEKSC